MQLALLFAVNYKALHGAFEFNSVPYYGVLFSQLILITSCRASEPCCFKLLSFKLRVIWWWWYAGGRVIGCVKIYFEISRQKLVCQCYFALQKFKIVKTKTKKVFMPQQMFWNHATYFIRSLTKIKYFIGHRHWPIKYHNFISYHIK